MEACEVHNMSYATVGTYAYSLVTFFRWHGNDWEKFGKFNQKDLQDWMIFLKKKDFNPHTINQRLCCVRAFYRFCFGKNIPHVAGVLYPKAYHKGPRKSQIVISRRERRSFLELKVKIPKKVMDPLKPSEIDRYLDGILRYRDFGIVLTMLLCGLRRQEVTYLRKEDVNFHQSCLKVRGKGKKERIVPMPFHLMQVFEKYLDVERPMKSSEYFFVILQGKKLGEQMSLSGIRSLFRKRRLRLNIPMARPHQFRHAFASDMARAGVPLTTIQRLMGHADPNTSMIYINLFMEDIKAEYDRAMVRIQERYAALSK
ncbi:MAG: site-specific integrase [Bdellovibrionota bacterium]